MKNDIKITSQITQKQIEELINYSNTDPVLKSNTTDIKRFKDREAFNLWLEKDRSIYVMTNNSDTLLGIIWFGKQTPPHNRNYTKSIDLINYQITFAIRIYGDARGKGFSKDFMKKAFQMYAEKTNFENELHNGVWLETNANNVIAIKAYKKFGFKQVSDVGENGRIIMVY